MVSYFNIPEKHFTLEIQVGHIFDINSFFTRELDKEIAVEEASKQLFPPGYDQIQAGSMIEVISDYESALSKVKIFVGLLEKLNNKYIQIIDAEHVKFRPIYKKGKNNYIEFDPAINKLVAPYRNKTIKILDDDLSELINRGFLSESEYRNIQHQKSTKRISKWALIISISSILVSILINVLPSFKTQEIRINNPFQFPDTLSVKVVNDLTLIEADTVKENFPSEVKTNLRKR